MSDGDWFLGETDTIQFLFSDPNAATGSAIPIDPSGTVKFRVTLADGTSTLLTQGVDAITHVATGNYVVTIQATQVGSFEIRGEAYNGTTLIVDQKTFNVVPSLAYPTGVYT